MKLAAALMVASIGWWLVLVTISMLMRDLCLWLGA